MLGYVPPGTDPSLTPQPWKWVPHPEVWVMILALALMYLYVTRILGPKAVPRGEPIITRSQSRWFFTGLVLLWVAADWPVHDLAEDYLYGCHMVQHLLLTLVVPPMMLLATPEWLARLVLGSSDSVAYRAFRFATRPVFAGIVFNLVYVGSHAPWIVDESVKSAGFHFTVHLVLVVVSIMMFVCICGPLKELRISLPGQALYLMLMGILPTIPAAWMVFAPNVVYKAYIHPWSSFWGLSPMGDQELAGFIMKFVAGLYMGSIIGVLLFRWAHQEEESTSIVRRKRDRDRLAQLDAAQLHARPLTYDDVEAEFARSDAPLEETPQ